MTARRLETVEVVLKVLKEPRAEESCVYVPLTRGRIRRFALCSLRTGLRGAGTASI